MYPPSYSTLSPASGEGTASFAPHSMTPTAPRSSWFWRDFGTSQIILSFGVLLTGNGPQTIPSYFEMFSETRHVNGVPNSLWADILYCNMTVTLSLQAECSKCNGKPTLLRHAVGSMPASILPCLGKPNDTPPIYFEIRMRGFGVFVSPKTFQKHKVKVWEPFPVNNTSKLKGIWDVPKSLPESRNRLKTLEQ